MTTHRLLEAAKELSDLIELASSIDEVEGSPELYELREALKQSIDTHPGRGTGRTYAQLDCLTADLRQSPTAEAAFYIIPHAALASEVRGIWQKQLKQDPGLLRTISLERIETETEALRLAGPSRFVGRIDHAVWQRIETPAQFASLLGIRRRFNVPEDPSIG